MLIVSMLLLASIIPAQCVDSPPLSPHKPRVSSPLRSESPTDSDSSSRSTPSLARQEKCIIRPLLGEMICILKNVGKKRSFCASISCEDSSFPRLKDASSIIRRKARRVVRLYDEAIAIGTLDQANGEKVDAIEKILYTIVPLIEQIELYFDDHARDGLLPEEVSPYNLYVI